MIAEGGREYLLLDDGFGASHFLGVDDLARLLRSGASGGAGCGLQLVFLSSCHSRRLGDAFLAAGARSVVAVRRSERVRDSAALLFAAAFYHALFAASSTSASAAAAAPTSPRDSRSPPLFSAFASSGGGGSGGGGCDRLLVGCCVWTPVGQRWL